MGPVQYTVLVNQTAIHGVPTALNAVNQALLRAWTGAPDASIRLVNNPLPMVLGEDALVVNQMSGEGFTGLSLRSGCPAENCRGYEEGRSLWLSLLT